MVCVPPRDFVFPRKIFSAFLQSEHKVSQWNTKHFGKKMQSFSEERKTFVKERKSLDKYIFPSPCPFRCFVYCNDGNLVFSLLNLFWQSQWRKWSRFWESIPLTPTVGVGNRCQLPEEALHQLWLRNGVGFCVPCDWLRHANVQVYHLIDLAAHVHFHLLQKYLGKYKYLWNHLYFYKCIQIIKCVLIWSIRQTTESNGVPCTLKNDDKEVPCTLERVPDQASICDKLEVRTCCKNRRGLK